MPRSGTGRVGVHEYDLPACADYLEAGVAIYYPLPAERSDGDHGGGREACLSALRQDVDLTADRIASGWGTGAVTLSRALRVCGTDEMIAWMVIASLDGFCDGLWEAWEYADVGSVEETVYWEAGIACDEVLLGS